MRSSIGRVAIRRVGGGAQSTNKTLQSVWHLQRVDIIRIPENPLASSHSSFSLQRSYTTTTNVASKAKSKAKSITKANPKPKVKKAVEKPVKKKPVKRRVAAKKPKPKAKKPKRKPVKPLTEEQKLKAQVKELKIKALLDGPKGKPSTAWTVVLAEIMQASAGNNVSTKSVEAATKYRSLSPEELEAYNHTANQNKAVNFIARKKWVESHTPDQINTANNARKLLRKKLNTPGKYNLIQDSRLPKQPSSPRLWFLKERFASGDLKGVSIIEANRLITKEWEALSASEKKTYEDLSSSDKQRYIQEYKTVYHRDSGAKV